MKLLKAYLATLDFIAPSLSARMVYKVMSNPRVKKLRGFEDAVLNKADKGDFQFRQFNIRYYTWGKSSVKTAILIHGWEGQAGNFGGLIPLLLDKGYRVVSFDAPAHGHSTKASTNLFDYIEVVSHFIKENQPDLIISHSFGSIASAVALTENQHISVNRWLVITSPYSFRERLEEAKTMVSVTDRTINKLIHKFEKDTGMIVADMNMKEYCSRISNVNDILIVHSIDDKIIPIDTSRRVHAELPQSEMIELKALGHYRILWSDELKNIVNKRLS